MKDTNRKISIISGPCSAEDRSQVLSVAAYCAEKRFDWFRAGIWKPRTKPGSFEGLGSPALDWLSEAQNEYGIDAMTEAANGQHVEHILEHHLRGVWIGARTAVNPFYVQEIADALKGADIDVFVKNPINPDMKLWMGAIERLERAGVRSVSAIHRGFAMYGQSKFRNEPYWQIPIEIMTERPDLPMYCDISHIAGTRDFLRELAQKALDLNYNGLMIETHPHPEEAMSDREQQLRPDQLSHLLESLVIRKSFEDDLTTQELILYREQMDGIDEQLVRLLAKRMDLSSRIGEVKKEHNISILSPKRWMQIVEQAVVEAKALGLTESFIRNVFKHIHDESIEKQTNVMQASNHKKLKS
jgi:chorismate mutase